MTSPRRRRRPRPFPSSHALAAINPQQHPRSVPPLLVDFFRALGKDPPASSTDAPTGRQDGAPSSAASLQAGAGTARAKRSAEDLGGSPLDELDGGHADLALLLDGPAASASSALTDAQHRRFLQLALSLEERSDKPVSSWKEATRKEYNKLVRLVKSEQELYRRALAAFWAGNRDGRLSVGCTTDDSDSAASAAAAAVPFVRAARTLKEIHCATWRSRLGSGAVPRSYGKCRQVITFEVSDQFTTLSLDSILPQVVQDGTSDAKPADVTPDTRDAIQDVVPPDSVIPPPKQDDDGVFGTSPLLVNDDEAFTLANTHNADVVTTEETLRSILKIADHEKCPPLLIPVSRSTATSIVVMESPVPTSYASPRECLEVGVKEALRQLLGNKNSIDKPSFGYTILAIPCRTRLPLRVLVRHDCRVALGEDPREGQSIRGIHARVEYFPERGRELPASIDRSMWALDHLLSGHSENAQVTICRVDPKDMRCVGWDDASWASATIEPSRWYENTNQGSAVDHWRRLASLLSASRTIGAGRHVLAFPGRRSDAALSAPLSVTVHESEEGGEIDLLTELKQSNGLPPGPVEFARCQRYWQWECENRVPYTFQVARPKIRDGGERT
jgi:hypothetical protein